MLNNLLSLGGLLDGYKTKIGTTLLLLIGMAKALGYPVPEGVEYVIGAYTAHGIRDALNKVHVDVKKDA